MLDLSGHSSSHMLPIWAGRGREHGLAGEHTDGHLLATRISYWTGHFSLTTSL